MIGLRIIMVHSGDLDIDTGGGVHTYELLRQLSNNHDVTCLVSKTNLPKIIPNVQSIPRINVKGLRSLSFDIFVGIYIIYLSIIKKPDIIYARKPGFGLSPAIISKIIKASYIVELNGLLKNDIQMVNPETKQYLIGMLNTIEKINYILCNNIVAVTKEIKKVLIDVYHTPEIKIVVIENGVNTELFKPIDREVALKKINLDPTKKYVCFVGGLAPWHGVHYLIEAAPAIINKIPNVIFLIVGDGPMKEFLVDKILSTGLSKNFLFTGKISQSKIPLYINSSSVCVAPFTIQRNITTGLSPLKIYEYLACGKPVVSSNLSCVKDILEKTHGGILVEPGNVGELENALISIINEPYQIDAESETISEYVRKNHSWKAVSEKTEHLFYISMGMNVDCH